MIPLSELISDSELLTDALEALGPTPELLDRLYYDDFAYNESDDHVSISISLGIDGDTSFDLPGGFSIRIGEQESLTTMVLQVRSGPNGFAVAIEDIAIVLTIPDNLLRPAAPEDGSETPERVEVIVQGGLIFDEARRLRVEGFDSGTLPRSFVGSSSIVISASDITIDTDRGVLLGQAKVELPEGLPALGPEDLVLTGAVIGPAGVSGRLEAVYTPEFDAEARRFVGRGSGELLGVPFAFSSLAIELFENHLRDTELRGMLLLPFFEDPIAVAISWQEDGAFSVRVIAESARIRIEEGPLKLVGRVSIDTSNDTYAGTIRMTLDGRPAEQADPIEVRRVVLSRECVSFTFTEPHLGRWLGQLASDPGDPSQSAEVEVTLRVLFGDGGVREVRIDGSVSGEPLTLALPWFKVQLPRRSPQESTLLSLVLGAAGTGLDHIGVALTLAPTSTPDPVPTPGESPPDTYLIASSDFPWERDEAREVQSDQTATSTASMLALGVDIKRRATLVLLDFDLSEGGLPAFFRELPVPLEPLGSATSEQLRQPTPWGLPGQETETLPLSPQSFGAMLAINTDRFTFPFLRRGETGDAADGDSQFLQIKSGTGVGVDFASESVSLPLEITVRIGTLVLDTTIALEFSWERFAFKVSHDDGLKLLSSQQTMTPLEKHLGLGWRFVGAPLGDRFHHLTLVTKDYNYQLQQADGAVIEIEYGELGEEPVVFAISDFALGGNGLNVTATVKDQPAKLNGLDTRFRFQGSKLEIRENRINDFTLMGSGPMPPALVGDATVDVALQLAQRGGHLSLVSGSARLQGDQLLHCKGTRFRFAIDALGLRFVQEDGFHLYFTLTGSAQFTPAPGDDADGPLALLSNIKIDLVDCPLTGDARVIARHIKFMVELPKPVGFSFLGAFDMEIRGIGFVPQAEAFDGDGAMLVAGKLAFAEGAGDTPDPRADVHKLLIGLPKPGSFVPRIHFEDLPVNLNLGSAFRVNGVVDFHDGNLEKGFSGEGSVQIQGLPTFAASFAFLRVRGDETSRWRRAWFLYLEARQVSFMIPVVQVYLREVGLGFGYRYTLASIKAADQANDVKALIEQLTVLSRTQGDLSKRDRWSIDLEEPGDDPRWTVAARALVSQTSAAPSPLRYDEANEKDLACLFLLDAVIALRSDLTFLMAFRGWLNANYHDYFKADPELRERPLLSGFVLLSPRHRRLLAHAASNPNGKLGQHPPLPDFVNKALANSQFSATLLIEPGLLHYELGWPNMLRWKDKLGPLEAEFRGGMIFRVSGDELVTGTSYLARAKLELQGEKNLGIVGARVSALAQVAFGARYIGLVNLREPTESALYGGVGLEAHIKFAIEFWIRLKLGFIKITKSFRFSLGIDFTAGLEIGIAGLAPDAIGLRGSGTLAVSMMGRTLQLSIHVGANESAVERARLMTEHVLNYGLEASDVDTLPGVALPAARSALRTASKRSVRTLRGATRSFSALAEEDVLTFRIPNYTVFVVRDVGPGGATSYFVLIPEGQRDDLGVLVEESGFLPAPPADGVTPVADFGIDIPQTSPVDHYDPLTGQWVQHQPSASRIAFTWKAAWDTVVAIPQPSPGEGEGDFDVEPLTLRQYLRHAYINEDDASDPTKVTPLGDPQPLPAASTVEDDRVHSPRDNAYESAVRGALEQFEGSPFFKRDPGSSYERLLEAAYHEGTTIYRQGGQVGASGSAELERMEKVQVAQQLRGLIVHDLVADLREHAALPETEAAAFRGNSIAFQLGLVFRVSGARPAWLDQPVDEAVQPIITQRRGVEAALDPESVRVRAFNVTSASFATNPPQFRRVRQLTDARTIAIDWDLAWEQPPADRRAHQADPDHHLVHYHVRRRPLDSSEREVVFTVKSAHTLHRQASEEEGADDLLVRLRPRFQLVDHFADDTLADLAALPASGRSYLYTITPVDFAGSLGRPLTVVATRRPSEPPQVPVNGELAVTYRVDEDAATAPEDGAHTPQLLSPHEVRVTWSEPPPPRDGIAITVAKYRLLLRRDAILPVGSYGLDSTTAGTRTRMLPTTNARPLPNDIKIELDVEGPADARKAVIDIDALVTAGAFPGGGAAWEPLSYRAYLQTESVNGVPSALAPVQILLRLEPAGGEGERREERRPGELEWLPRPVSLPYLPAEDQLATPGIVHVPMPRSSASDEELRFGGDLRGVEFAPHPGGKRCIRFRWNRGPSSAADYPLALGAGFQILELDADAHPQDTFTSGAKLAAALRPIQDVQMLPADELALAPGDTLDAGQWEAWYPSSVRRLTGSAGVPGVEPFGPWYSWRDSILAWPEWPGVTGDDRSARRTALHPVLQTIVEGLARPGEARTAPRFRVDLQASPPMQPGNLASFLRATASDADPYGWGVLQRLGLGIALSLRDAATGTPVLGDALLAAIHDVIRSRPDLSQPSVARHLHVELLFQPGRSLRLERSPADQPEDLLALVQISLRPAVLQQLRYGAVSFTAAPGLVDLLFAVAPGAPCSVVLPSTPASGQLELAAGSDEMVVRRAVEVPIDGQAVVLVRGATPALVGVPLAVSLSGAAAAQLDQQLGDRFEYRAAPQPHVRVRFAPGRLPADRAALLRTILGSSNAAAADLLASAQASSFTPLDARAARFQVSADELAASFAASSSPGSAAAEWTRFRRLLESLSSPDPTVPEDQKIRIPRSADALAGELPALLGWAQRFFDAGGALAASPGGLAETLPGPWLATAYPRVSAPAFAAADALGRLSYDHVLEDGWAHNYRYYVRPAGRYDLLWQSLRRSPALFETAPPVALVEPDPLAGGLDVVLERTRPVAPPLVLASGRLDPATQAGGAAAPGSTWEVIVAQHPEQALVEKNQTLVRRLGFRQVALALVRRFAFADWPERLAQASGQPAIDVEAVEAHYPAVPNAYPALPDRLALEAPLSGADARSIDLPLRIGAFQQAAQAVQWEGVPFFYEHRLLLVAQAASTASTLTELTQRDFEYRTPPPVASIEPARVSWPEAPAELRARRISIPLRRLWESLPAAVQQRWPSEAPGARYTPSWLPDLDIVYQIVELRSGNVEVQAELLFDASQQPVLRRQLGRRVRVDTTGLSRPQSPEGRYELALTVQPVAEIELAGSYELSSIPEPTRSKLSIVRGTPGESRDRLSFVGTVTHEDRANLAALEASDRAAMDRLWAEAFTSEPISEAPPALPAALAGFVDVLPAEECRLVWEGSMSAAERDALLALPADAELRAAIERLIAADALDGVRTASAPRGPEHRPQVLDGKASLVSADGAYTALTWLGPMLAADELALDDWARIRALAISVTALKRAVAEAEVAVPVTPPRPLPEELPPVLDESLLFGDSTLTWRAPAPSDVARAQLLGVVADEGFVEARGALLLAIDAPQTVPLAADVPRPELPPVLNGRLLIEPTALSWASPAPNDDERIALAVLVADPAFLAGVTALLQLIDVNRTVSMAPLPGRPRQIDLPASLAGQLVVMPTELRWIGQPPTEMQRDAMGALDGDAAFTAAVQDLIEARDAFLVSVPFVSPLRPVLTADHLLAEKLVIGRAELRVHGLLPRTDALALRALFPLGADRLATARLHVATLQSGLRGSDLRIRALRGNAPPSPLVSLHRLPL
jgi:hypothetical protein